MSEQPDQPESVVAWYRARNDEHRKRTVEISKPGRREAKKREQESLAARAPAPPRMPKRRARRDVLETAHPSRPLGSARNRRLWRAVAFLHALAQARHAATRRVAAELTAAERVQHGDDATGSVCAPLVLPAWAEKTLAREQIASKERRARLTRIAVRFGTVHERDRANQQANANEDAAKHAIENAERTMREGLRLGRPLRNEWEWESGALIPAPPALDDEQRAKLLEGMQRAFHATLQARDDATTFRTQGHALRARAGFLRTKLGQMFSSRVSRAAYREMLRAA